VSDVYWTIVLFIANLLSAIQVALRVLLENTVEFTINGELKYAKMPEMGLITCPISITV
jgi:hypothetical protein